MHALSAFSAAPSALDWYPDLHPGLMAGPRYWRPFGPKKEAPPGGISQMGTPPFSPRIIWILARAMRAKRVASPFERPCHNCLRPGEYPLRRKCRVRRLLSEQITAKQGIHIRFVGIFFHLFQRIGFLSFSPLSRQLSSIQEPGRPDHGHPQRYRDPGPAALRPCP